MPCFVTLEKSLVPRLNGKEDLSSVMNQKLMFSAKIITLVFIMFSLAAKVHARRWPCLSLCYCQKIRKNIINRLTPLPARAYCDYDPQDSRLWFYRRRRVVGVRHDHLVWTLRISDGWTGLDPQLGLGRHQTLHGGITLANHNVWKLDCLQWTIWALHLRLWQHNPSSNLEHG